MTAGAKPVVRGCGRRVKGGVYLEVAESPFGRPLEDFLIDPPRTINPDELGLSAIGVKLVELDGAWHVMDWVGESHYPNVADFLEEGRRFGFSRRVARTLDFSKLTPESRLLLVHSRAVIAERDAYQLDRQHTDGCGWFCPKHLAEHRQTTTGPEFPMCAALWWEDIEGGEPATTKEEPRRVVRVMPSFEYHGHARPDSVSEPVYFPGLIASLPLGRIVVVKDTDDRHRPAVQKASAARLPVEEVEE